MTYTVCGPLLPQGEPPIVYKSDDLGKAYAVMIEIRRVVRQKNYHVYKNGSGTSRMCRVCKMVIPHNLSGCVQHLNDYDITPKTEKVQDFRGLDITQLKVDVIIDGNNRVIECRCHGLDNRLTDWNLDSNIDIDANANLDEVILYRPITSDNKFLRSLTGTEIILEGLIGIGKSTLGKSLSGYLEKNGLPVKFFPEFVNESLLSLYISDMKKYAFTFQVIVARERLRIYDEAKKFSSKGGISIIDRGLIGDLTFATMQRDKGFINSTEWEVYKSLVELRHDEPMITVHLNGSPQLAYTRMQERKISSEISGYTVGYFEDLNDAYMKILEDVGKNINILRIPWDIDHVMADGVISDRECRDFLTKIRDHLNK
jgi:deoxyadenosine/deoxycytidine kinase